VALTGLAEDGSELKLSVPVTLSHLPNVPDSPPAIHALAARKIIQDIEDGQHAITTSVPGDADLLARTVKASIVRLAKTYSISSSQTSFVAVDEAGTQHASPPVSSIPERPQMKGFARAMKRTPFLASRKMAQPRARFVAVPDSSSDSDGGASIEDINAATASLSSISAQAGSELSSQNQKLDRLLAKLSASSSQSQRLARLSAPAWKQPESWAVAVKVCSRSLDPSNISNLTARARKTTYLE
jgi:hypothetical protein